MKDQDDIDNHNVSINCKKNDDVVDFNKTQNTIKNEVIVNNNYEKMKLQKNAMTKIKMPNLTLIMITQQNETQNML